MLYSRPSLALGPSLAIPGHRHIRLCLPAPDKNLSPGKVLRPRPFEAKALEGGFGCSGQGRITLPCLFKPVNPTAACFLFDTATPWNLAGPKQSLSSRFLPRVPKECLPLIRNVRPLRCQDTGEGSCRPLYAASRLYGAFTNRLLHLYRSGPQLKALHFPAEQPSPLRRGSMWQPQHGPSIPRRYLVAHSLGALPVFYVLGALELVEGRKAVNG